MKSLILEIIKKNIKRPLKRIFKDQNLKIEVKGKVSTKNLIMGSGLRYLLLTTYITSKLRSLYIFFIRLFGFIIVNHIVLVFWN